MRYHLTRETLATILKNEKVEDLNAGSIEAVVRSESGIPDYSPEPFFQIDPFDGTKIVYNSSRASRPHDNETPPESIPEEEDLNKEANFVTTGKTTSVIDVAPLSEGFTFINFNLFPALFPHEEESGDASTISGIHFLQWTSSYQDRDWHNMPVSDCSVALQRVAALEKTMLSDREGYFTFFKNCGRLVGGSIAQGHQQMGFTTVQPKRNAQLEDFARREKRSVPDFMLKKNPDNLLVKDFGKVVLLVPYFMRRPYNMMLMVKDGSKELLHQLDDLEIEQVAAGWKVGIRIMRSVLNRIGKSIAYNIIADTGKGTGVFFDFYPYTQETGGFEHLGLYVCQSTPELCADTIRSYCKEELE